MHDRHTKAPGVAVGITEPMIEALVHAFYASVRRDEMLGPIFDAQIDDWDAHLAKLCRFWSSVTLMTGTYEGRPMAVHAALPAIEGEHFARWLALFAETAHAVCPPDAAALFVDRAQRIAESLKHGIDLHLGRGRLAAVNAP
ncbi:group III truncated hemoglobin [Hyphomicrobium sp. NDB2Meth4]|uniref:group III truncated hemoglobin n=1 Tax=Hyphomicrobium sp. NDB2Meth4 TaxID=1892846 RepID=UPI0009306B4D|nr:group III truncated hemoglobin [Hyphomicrobium sp. NDB2Meth4]